MLSDHFQWYEEQEPSGVQLLSLSVPRKRSAGKLRSAICGYYLAGMFTREEASRMRQEFWTTLGRYLSPVPSAEGWKINWINYHTRLKDVYFRMAADQKKASIAISIEHRDPELQELFFQQFVELKTMLHATVGEEWTWALHDASDGKKVTRIYKSISGVSVLNRDDWPSLISFFKPRIIALDSFWENARYSFDSLR